MNLCSTQKEVEDLQKRFVELVKNYTTIRAEDTNPVLRDLNALQRELEAEEVEFYRRLNITANPNRDTLREMQDKIDRMNEDKGFLSMSNAADGFDALIAGIGQSTTIDFSEEVILMLPDEFNSFVTEELLPNGAERLENANSLLLANALNNAIVARAQRAAPNGVILTASAKKQPSGSNIISYSPNKMAKEYGLDITQTLSDGMPQFMTLFDTKVQSRGLGALIDTFNAHRTGDGVMITFKMAPNVGSSVLKKLKSNFGLDISQGSLNEKAGIAAELKRRLYQRITNPEIWKYVEYEFDTNFSQQGWFDVNRSVSSIKGFLGEVKAAAAMDYICGSYGQARPTGNLHYQLANTKVEVPIDLWFKDTGFQIKNYQVDKYGKVDFVERGAAMHTVLTNRFDIQQPIRDILEELFVAEAYNTPAQMASSAYREVYDKFEGYEHQATNLMKDYAYNIFKLKKYFTDIENQIFTNPEKPYYNTFFIINSTIVPGSDIIAAFIEIIKRKGLFSNMDKVNTNISLYYPKDPTAYTGRKPNEPAEFEDVASKIKIGYYVTLSLGEILKEAYTRALMI